jgi:hypothetical protein
MPETTKKQANPTQKEILLNLASALDLFHTSEGEVYAKIPVSNHYETWHVRSKGFRGWLSGLFYQREGKVPNAQSMNDALTTIEGIGQFESPQDEVHVRVAGYDGRIYLDLANKKWEVVEISKDGWKVIKNSEVNFRRPKGLLPLPYPDRNGDLNCLRSYLNLPDGDQGEVNWRLIIGWLVQVGRPQGPYPVLVLNGEQGSAKSTLSRFLKMIIDPCTVPLRTMPRSERDLAISANNNWTLVFDNLSGMRAWLSDAICRLSTGGGFSTRQLYTNDEETLFNSMRPVILNGIDEMVTRHDLADRCLFLNFPPISDAQRLTEQELGQRFEKDHSLILGVILNALVTALKNISETTLEEMPRMADFALWVQAAEPALPWEENGFLSAYNTNRKEVIDLALDADLVASEIRKLMTAMDAWEGTPTELLDQLEKEMTDKEIHKKAWPKTPAWLSRRLRRAASFLRRSGIEVDFDHKDANRRTIRLSRIMEQNTVTPVTTVFSNGGEVLINDDTEDATDTNDGNDNNNGTNSITHQPTPATCGDCSNFSIEAGWIGCKMVNQRVSDLEICPLTAD